MKTRQRAVKDARENTPHHNVYVGHYIEVNLVIGAKDYNLNRVVNCVLPNIEIDMVSYSAYDALFPLRLTEALDYIERNARFTSYFDDLFDRKVFVGEFDSMCEYTHTGKVLHQNSFNLVRQAIFSALKWGVPFMLYWELYSNNQDKYYCLIEPNGNKNAMYQKIQNIISKLLFIEEFCLKVFNYQITYRDVTHLSYYCEKSFKEIINCLLDDYLIKRFNNKNEHIIDEYF